MQNHLSIEAHQVLNLSFIPDTDSHTILEPLEVIEGILDDQLSIYWGTSGSQPFILVFDTLKGAIVEPLEMLQALFDAESYPEPFIPLSDNDSGTIWHP